MSATIKSFVADQVAWMRSQSDDVRVFTLPVEPKPASRPRISKWGVYYGKPYTTFRQTAQPYADAYDSYKPIEGPIAVLCEIVCTKPKTGKLNFPRGDVDNYVKGPLDVMTKSGKFWNDDVQVVSINCVKRYTDLNEGETAACNLYLFPLGGTMK
tara:strand:+ start:224 stop:688 length:465 start_codon:yes stop_codon:yes gene_type:complete